MPHGDTKLHDRCQRKFHSCLKYLCTTSHHTGYNLAPFLFRNAIVPALYERHLGHLSLLHFVPDLQSNLRSGLGRFGLHISHCDGSLQAWTERTRGYRSYLVLASRIIYLRSPPRRGLHPHDANPLPRYLSEFSLRSQDVLSSQEGPPALPASRPWPPHSPAEGTLGGGRIPVEVVPVQAQPSLEAEGIAGTQPRRVDARVLQELTSDGYRMFRWHGNLEPILPCVPTPRDAAPVNTVQCNVRPCHERHVNQIKPARQNLRHRLCCTSTLHGQQLHRILEVLHAHIAVECVHLLLEVLHVPELRRAIYNHVHVITRVGDDGVVNDAPILVNDKGEAPRSG
mmetsp:Transcript_63054/g.186258  ORF Transcript_63054/g.186258 Transcript_63054/m.186258 type:complete len:340 (-) Transcript_63054:507-1526(-)